MSCVNTDYSNTIFYKISCKDENIHDVYIGHTINFIQRKHAHKQCCSNTKSLNYNCKLYQFIRQQGGWDNWNMDIIAFHKCDGLQSAKIYEQKYYDEFNATLNSIEPNPKPKPKLATKMASHDKHIDIIKQTSTKEINTLINRDVNNIFTIDKLFTICSEIIMAQNKDLIEIIMAQNKELVTQNNELVMENEELTTQTEEFMENTKEFNMNLFFDNHFNHDVINIDAFFSSLPITRQTYDDIQENGVEATLTKMIVDKLNNTHVMKRPIHCINTKTKDIYVRYCNKWEKDKNNCTVIVTAICKFIETLHISCDKYRDDNDELYRDLSFDVFQDIVIGRCDGTLERSFRDGIFLKEIADNTQLFKDKNMDIIIK
tara:strand:- start:53 stop:1171 length:1119 start_codon:yes stop_codon:yes gene_type:complete